MTDVKAPGVFARPFLGRRARAKSAAAAPPPKPRRQPSLVRRLIVLHAVLSALVLVAGGVTLSAFFAERSIAAFDERLGDDVLDLVRGTSVDETGDVAAPTLTDARTGYAYSGKYWELVTPAGGGQVRAIDRSRSMWDAPDFALPAGGEAELASQAGKTVYYDGIGPAPTGAAPPQPGAPIGKEPVRIAAEEVRIAGVKDPIIFMVAEDRSPINATIRTFAVSVAIALAALLAMLIGGVMLQVRFGLRPLFRLQREVAAVRTGKTDRVGDDYPAELEPLASELNALVTHNQEVVERQRTHVGNLAHALKTPLTVMDAEAQARPGPLGEVVRRQVEVMREQVDHHLRRARLGPPARRRRAHRRRAAAGRAGADAGANLPGKGGGDRLARARRPLLPRRAPGPARAGRQRDGKRLQVVQDAGQGHGRGARCDALQPDRRGRRTGAGGEGPH